MINMEMELRRIKALEKTINGLLGQELSEQLPRIVELIDQMRELVDKLSMDTEEETIDLWYDTLLDFEKRCSNLRSVPQQQPPTLIDINESKPNVYLLKEKPLEHDGEVESFRPFLIRFNSAVGDVAEVEEAVKFRQLCSAVYPGDLNSIIELSYDKAIAFLKEKYTSADRIRLYLAEKLGRLEVRHDGDAQGLRELKEAVATARIIAAQCDDQTVTTDLFDMVF